MIGTSSNQGVSFVSAAREIRDQAGGSGPQFLDVAGKPRQTFLDVLDAGGV